MSIKIKGSFINWYLRTFKLKEIIDRLEYHANWSPASYQQFQSRMKRY